MWIHCFYVKHCLIKYDIYNLYAEITQQQRTSDGIGLGAIAGIAVTLIVTIATIIVVVIIVVIVIFRLDVGL